MERIETERLRIHPLTVQQLQLYLQNDGSLEKELGLLVTYQVISPDLKNTLENYFLPLVKQHPDQFYFYTLWSMVLKEQNVMAGDLCFKGPPTEEGQVEIGYGTHAQLQGQGLMTEAVAALLVWCRNRPEIKTVLAETEPENIASEKVLMKNSFNRYHTSRDGSWWTISV